jgi:hypothetical protein
MHVDPSISWTIKEIEINFAWTINYLWNAEWNIYKYYVVFWGRWEPSTGILILPDSQLDSFKFIFRFIVMFIFRFLEVSFVYFYVLKMINET